MATGQSIEAVDAIRRFNRFSTGRIGIGRHLVDECTRFACQSGYRSISLWTQGARVGARRIYQAAGYRLIKPEPHRSFGHGLIGETWELQL